MKFNDSYVIKKTLFGKLYLANQETGDVIDVNQTTAEIIEFIKDYDLSTETLIEKLCLEYDATPDEISEDVVDIIRLLKDYNVIY